MKVIAYGKDAIQAAPYLPTNTSVTITAVQKNHVRFFPKVHANQNIKPGTIAKNSFIKIITISTSADMLLCKELHVPHITRVLFNNSELIAKNIENVTWTLLYSANSGASCTTSCTMRTEHFFFHCYLYTFLARREICRVDITTDLLLFGSNELQ